MTLKELLERFADPDLEPRKQSKEELEKMPVKFCTTPDNEYTALSVYTHNNTIWVDLGKEEL